MSTDRHFSGNDFKISGAIPTSDNVIIFCLIENAKKKKAFPPDAPAGKGMANEKMKQF